MMFVGTLNFKFKGLQADRHVMPMRHLGAALTGLDRIINTGLIAVAYKRPPKKREKFEVFVVAQQPIRGSVEIAALLEHAPWMLPVVQDFLVSGGVEASFRFISYVMTRLGGRPKEAEMHIQALLEMNRDHLSARDTSEQRQHETLRMALEAATGAVAPAAELVVKSVGVSSSRLLVSGPKGETTEVDEPMADAIRSKSGDEVGDLTAFTVKVDGFSHRKRQLKIEHPDRDGKLLNAEVRDPVFENAPNPYTDAAVNKRELSVLAKPVYRDGELRLLYVMALS